MSHLLVALFRVRGEKSYLQSELFTRVLRRLVHFFCQCVEVAIEDKMVSKCPKATKPGQVHPHSKASRLKGNKSLQLNVMDRFLTRGSGFVTGKDMSLHEVGIRDSRKYGSRTTAEYCCRLLMKGVDYMTQYEKDNSWKTINCSFDMASVSHESVLVL